MRYLSPKYRSSGSLLTLLTGIFVAGIVGAAATHQLERSMFSRIGSHDLPIPFPQTHGSAGYDLQASENYRVAFTPVLVKTGFSVQIPKGHVGMICSRSGLALRNSVFVLNAPGIIDSDYQGEIGVILMNLAGEDFNVKIGDRIAQLVIVPCLATPTLLSRFGRGDGGFGSTGT